VKAQEIEEAAEKLAIYVNNKKNFSGEGEI
jgi:hypothetical protein